ncbi:MAG: DNA double-strand break repair nuclease NurA [Chloroflexota bacterium]
MPYEREVASKASHFDIVKNPEVARFLEQCDYLTVPSEEEGKALASRFSVVPPVDESDLPNYVIAVDGSYYESSIDERLPSTKVGYVKIGSVLIDMAQYKSLRVHDGRYVDPFRVAQIQNSNSPLTFALPSANIRWKGKGSVRDSFRATVDEHLYGSKTRFIEGDPTTSLRTTLFHLASRRPGTMGTADPSRLKVHKCPSCEKGPIELLDVPGPQPCPFCGAEVYPSDCLRLWEEVSDYQSNVQALSRFMLQVEHMMPIHYIRYMAENSLPSLASTSFFVDGPLAVFGNGAWLHGSIMRYLCEVNEILRHAGLPRMIVIGLQKTGQVADHAMLIERHIPPNRILPLDDEYRYRYVLAGRDASSNGFGSETYYGQDFIYKTYSRRIFVFALPYPFASKAGAGPNFGLVKTEASRYSELSRALTLINHFESDLYENAVVPIALAHRYTAISLVPGGRVLDLLTRRALTSGPS